MLEDHSRDTAARPSRQRGGRQTPLPRKYRGLMLVVFVLAAGVLGANDLKLIVPIAGVQNIDWVLSQHMDHDPTQGVRDYRSGPLAYNGHRGTDFDGPNFRWMDRGHPVLAAAAGHVVDLRDGMFDRNVGEHVPRTNCGGGGNFVEIEHANGWRTAYLHLKKASVRAKVGQEVAAGDTLGVVGSSGCSTQPHLHFEVKNQQQRRVDPFVEKLWIDAPDYEIPITIMDSHVQGSGVDDWQVLKDPPPSITSIAPSSILTVGLSVAGVKRGTHIRILILNGGTTHKGEIIVQEALRHSFWYWSFRVNKRSGSWKVAVFINGKRDASVHYEIPVG